MAIPKIIHYCWFSGDKYPHLVKECLKTWKNVIPDYEFRLWDAKSFDFKSIQFVKEAFENHQWAFVSDYIRLYALYHYGGVYLDSDVLVRHRFDEWHSLKFFSGIETRNQEHTNFWIEAAIMGSEPGNEMIKETMKYYEFVPFIKNDGSFDTTAAPSIITPIFKKFYNWIPQEGTVHLKDDIVVFGEDEITCSFYPLKESVRLFHCNNRSWIAPSNQRGFLFKFCYKHDLMRHYKKLEILKSRLFK